ncbi:glycosyltransferase family 39 protein [Tolypothrix sp. FACHB-123]|uniref:ArnT family glycosyltransferase n=1 Tax=Tolypothrix sp. FACHB-123 TaxID=2692868 RepID=UPI0016844999|nr:glycosyltransferase family 39 protein [Tolypothrix sp. FACHB-123]MBD2353226.1 glycosyltransferase family 39 protein [Tolypothrix sp. FACHB-123]
MNYSNSRMSKDYLILVIIWSIGLIIDRLWFFLDDSIPSYDQSAHLTTALHHFRIFHNFHIFSRDWWLSLWQLTPSYRAPFVYICTVPFFFLFGKGYDQASLVNLIYSAVIIISVYHLAKYLFNSTKIGITASIFCLLFPILGIMRTDYLLDYGLTAIVTLTFTILTIWKDSDRGLKSWILTLGFGLGIGLIMLAKPTGFIFLLIPGILTFINFVRKRKYIKLLQTCLSLIVAWLICGSWYSLNWLTIITSAINANNVGKAEGDPPSTTIAGWLVYPQILPETVGFPILFVSIGILLVYLIKHKFSREGVLEKWNSSGVNWLLIFLLSSYIICSLGTNKDVRFILPLFPIISLILSYCFNLINSKHFDRVRFIAIGLSAIILVNNLFSLPLIQGWGGKHLPSDEGTKYPLAQLIDKINQTNPYLMSTLGVIPVSTPQVNEFTLDYFGTLADFRVYGRKVTMKLSQIEQDLKYFPWYVTKDNEPDEPGERGETKRKFKALVESDPDLKLQADWVLPSGDKLRLYRRVNPDVVVEKVNNVNSGINLKPVISNNQLVAGHSNPVSYQITGEWDDLQNGLLLLKWQHDKSSWYHDHAIGLGNLYCGVKCHPQENFQVSETISTFLPQQLGLGEYQLSAQYLDRRTGKVTSLNIPATTVTVTDKGKIDKAPALDLVSHMSQLALELQKGKLDNIFVQIDNFNQYDPTQDYLKQIELAANYRLQNEPSNLNWRYTLVLAELLQRQVPELIENLTELTKYDAKNPYVWLYLAFIYLYDFQPRQAEPKLAIAEKLNPNIPELKTLKTVTNIMKFLPIINF